MEFSLNTPALLFPAISLLLLAYTNRFLYMGQLIRALHANYQATGDEGIIRQIENLRRRVRLTRNMQALGALSFFLCVLCMFLLFLGWVAPAKGAFGLSLLFLLASLGLSTQEIFISEQALAVQLGDLERERRQAG